MGLDNFCEGRTTHTNAGASPAIEEWKNGNSSHQGVFDNALDMGSTEQLKEALNVVQEIHFNRIGYASLRGLVYTDGSVYSSNQTKIVGALIARNNGTQDSKAVNGVELEPGDIFLENGTSVTFNKEYFEGEESISTGDARLSLSAWLPAP